MNRGLTAIRYTFRLNLTMPILSKFYKTYTKKCGVYMTYYEDLVKVYKFSLNHIPV